MNHQKRAPKSSNYETPEYLLVEKEFLVKIEEAISTLPEKQKEVFLLSRIEKKKYKEIAEIVENDTDTNNQSNVELDDKPSKKKKNVEKKKIEKKNSSIGNPWK